MRQGTLRRDDSLGRTLELFGMDVAHDGQDDG